MKKQYNRKHEVFFGEDFIKYALNVVELKDNLLAFSVTRYLLRAIMAGIIIAFGYVTYILIDAHFSEMSIVAGSSLEPLGHFLASWFFGFCLVFIYYTTAELFTSNMMLLSVGNYYNKISYKTMIKILGFCYLGNLLGGIFVGILLAKSTIITGNEEAINYLASLVATKQGYTTSAIGFYDMFVRAIFCNFFINLSMLVVYTGKIKQDSAKIIMILAGVFIFMFLGFEHSVANTAIFAIAGMTQLANPELASILNFNLGQAVINIIVVIIGNFVGGGILIGTYYAFLNDKRTLEE